MALDAPLPTYPDRKSYKDWLGPENTCIECKVVISGGGKNGNLATHVRTAHSVVYGTPITFLTLFLERS